jgi:hypothetical protein
VITNNLAIAHYLKGEHKNANTVMKMLFSNFREKWLIGKHTNPAYVLNYIMILTKNDMLTDAKAMNKKLIEYTESNAGVASDFKIKVIRHSVILYSKLLKFNKALQLLDKYYELTNEYIQHVQTKGPKEGTPGDADPVLGEIKSQMLYMKRVRAIVLFKMGNKGDAVKALKGKVN